MRAIERFRDVKLIQEGLLHLCPHETLNAISLYDELAVGLQQNPHQVRVLVGANFFLPGLIMILEPTLKNGLPGQLQVEILQGPPVLVLHHYLFSRPLQPELNLPYPFILSFHIVSGTALRPHQDFGSKFKSPKEVFSLLIVPQNSCVGEFDHTVMGEILLMGRSALPAGEF